MPPEKLQAKLKKYETFTEDKDLATFEALEEIAESLEPIKNIKLVEIKGDKGDKGDKGERGEKGDTGEQGPQGEKGEKGERGERGPAGTPGIDGRDGRDGRDGKDADPSDVLPLVEDRLPMLGERIRDSLELLQGDDRLDASAVKGLPEIEQQVREVRMVGGARGIQLYVDGAKKGLVQTMNLVAGTNITLTYTRSNGRNDILIDAAGGGPGAFTILTATGTIDDSNTAFTFASEPTAIVINGAWYRQTGGAITWTWNGGTSTATLSVPVGTGGDIYAVA